MVKTRSKPKVILVSKKQMKDLTGDSYVGFAAYRQKKIYLQKNLSAEDKKSTLIHERGHYRFRKKKVRVGKKVIEEMKKNPTYRSLKKEGYKPKKIPEELLIEAHTQIKTKNGEFKQEFKQKYPRTYKKYIHIFER
jgi:Zn-dependent peptidase ImmA (M78 family)|tara:strand:- start:383 stop:790 length:408 start_codon:yes stop_codon:yes gene_type:complete